MKAKFTYAKADYASLSATPLHNPATKQKHRELKEKHEDEIVSKILHKRSWK